MSPTANHAPREESVSIQEDVAAFLAANSDEPYRLFQAKLIPTIPAASIVGVRTPLLRSYAKQLARRSDLHAFLNATPHRLFEENQLHAFIVSSAKDYETLLEGINAFLPFVDNWATCDQMSPRGLAARPDRTLSQAQTWMASTHPYTIRYGIGVLLALFLEDHFDPTILTWVCERQSSEYYVNMMRAWFFAEALAKQPAATMPFLEEERLDPWTHNKALQKARESRRIEPSLKEYLRTLKR